ncbi:MAG TPA: F0F1 ATP synthase subunit A [Candidatus Kapabacteria bacterium]|jgi:F-type H+-transporting ATPase subunit a|nr:F0F1 ATP synthase subunit A [Candidatus Kapabacteria bacterium]
MKDPNDQLLAQADTKVDTTTGTPSTGAQGNDGAKQEGSVFTTLLKTLGDHRELHFGGAHIPLPILLFDNGVHFYPSLHSMKEAGLYTTDKDDHHIYRAGTEQAPSLDMSVTSLVAFQWISMLILMLVFIPMAKKYRRAGIRPLKGFHNAVEAVVVYVRDQIVLPNAGSEGRKLMPIFLTFFFFILTMNLIGLVPMGHSATGSLNVTAGLAIIAFFVIQIAAIAKNGIGAWLYHLTGGVPTWLWPIMVPVEVLGLFTKPFALAVRLFANMTAGHVILLSLIGLTFVAGAFIPVMIGFSLFINVLELLVAFIQAYIFTMLTSVFVGIATAGHDDHGHDEAHAAAH